jgi:hypothetical protein
MLHRSGRTGRIGLAALAALFALGLLGAGAGCKDKKKAKKPAAQQQPKDYNSMWGSIRSLGEEGKFNCNNGLKAYQEAGSADDRAKACDQMVKGYKQIIEAGNKADSLIEMARQQSPGRDFTGWEDEAARWMELLKPVKLTLPMDYLDRLNE